MSFAKISFSKIQDGLSVSPPFAGESVKAAPVSFRPGSAQQAHVVADGVEQLLLQRLECVAARGVKLLLCGHRVSGGPPGEERPRGGGAEG